MSDKLDLQFIHELSRKFFRKPHVKKTLLAIDSDYITGWEKWLQIEFATFLRDHAEIRTWWRESKYEIDKRVLASRSKCAVDFLVHQKGKQSHMALELKQVNSPNSCVCGMLRDRRKIAAIKRKNYDIRSVWCLGVHRDELPDEVRRLLRYHSDKMKISVNTENVITEVIGKTGYAFTIF